MVIESDSMVINGIQWDFMVIESDSMVINGI